MNTAGITSGGEDEPSNSIAGIENTPNYNYSVELNNDIGSGSNTPSPSGNYDLVRIYDMATPDITKAAEDTAVGMMETGSRDRSNPSN